MGRRKWEPSKDGSVNTVDSAVKSNDNCDHKLFYATRIKTLRIAAHISQAGLANVMGVSRSAVVNWETGRTRPDISNIPTLCKTLNIPIAEFFSDTGNGANWSREERRLLSTYRNLLPQHQRFLMKMTQELVDLEKQGTEKKQRPQLLCKKYAEDAVAAGIGTEAFEASCEQVYVHDTPILRKTDILFHVNGDSMEPRYLNHCTVMVREEKTLSYGDVGVFQIDGVLYMKEFRADGLHSFNPAYPTMEPSQYHDIRTIGRVIGIMEEEDFASMA